VKQTRQLTDIGKLPVFENNKVQLFTELLKLLCKVESKVLNDVAMSLPSGGEAELEGFAAYFDHANTRSDRFDNLENLLGGRHVDRNT
jgi:hypothetical protein